MYGQNLIGTGLTFSKVIGGISKTLGIANQVIPLYKEIKPIMSNAKGMLSVIKEFSNTKVQETKQNNFKNTNKIEKITTKKENSSSSNPVFFQ